ncbi:hypothetical protein WEI85_27130 [Actinomycetes bacterium KLBMP 9797]
MPPHVARRRTSTIHRWNTLSVTLSLFRELAGGASRAEVGRRLGLDPQTVRRFADATSVDELLANTRRESLLDPYKSYLHQRWNDGCADTAVLYAEIREQGFRGSIQTVRRYLQPLRPVDGGIRRHLRAPRVPTPPKPRRVAKWIMTDPAKLKAEEQRKLDAIRRRSTALEALASVEHRRNPLPPLRHHRQPDHRAQRPDHQKDHRPPSHLHHRSHLHEATGRGDLGPRWLWRSPPAPLVGQC